MESYGKEGEEEDDNDNPYYAIAFNWELISLLMYAPATDLQHHNIWLYELNT